LPVVPPDEAKVAAMIRGSGRDAGELICELPPVGGRATVAKVATNAVMAGCLPEYMPVIIAALRAMVDPRFNLHGIQATTHVAAPLLIVNGPTRNALAINSGAGLFGPGHRANATIGRAVRLLLLNIGGAWPGGLDKSTFGHPGKYTYCIAESEEVSPWEPLHVQRGFDSAQSTVTVFAAEAPHSCTNHIANDAIGILTTCADTMSTMGSNNAYVSGEYLVVLGPEHMETIRNDGWSKADVRNFLFHHATNRLGDLRFGGRYGPLYNRHWPRWLDRANDDERVPLVKDPDEIIVIVAGGAVGRFSLVVPGWGDYACHSVTLPIAF